MKTCFVPLVILLIFNGCVPVEQQGQNAGDDAQYYKKKTLRYENHTYEDDIRTVRLYPLTGGKNQKIHPAIKNLESKQPFILEFDEIGEEASNLFAKIIHCNAGWEPSSLSAAEYLTKYNEFHIRNYEFSSNTRLLYTHYRFKVPEITRTGNYILKVYRNQNEDRLVLTRRFVVYRNLVTINTDIRSANNPAKRASHQQINFDIIYPDMQINNPQKEIKVTIRQNHRWNQAIKTLEPLYVKKSENKLEYRHFNGQNLFPGLNEYRPFDIRSYKFKGQQVRKLNRSDSVINIHLKYHEPRSFRNYVQQQDINGKYKIENFEFGNEEITSEYVRVHFYLNYPSRIDGEVYAFGEMSSWETKEAFRLKYQPSEKVYHGSTLLKQGIYNYHYVVFSQSMDAPNEQKIEGSYKMTENIYDFLVYYRPIGAKADQVIGYHSTTYNGN